MNTKDDSYNQAVVFSVLCERTPHNKKTLTKDAENKPSVRNGNVAVKQATKQATKQDVK